MMFQLAIVRLGIYYVIISAHHQHKKNFAKQFSRNKIEFGSCDITFNTLN